MKKQTNNKGKGKRKRRVNRKKLGKVSPKMTSLPTQLAYLSPCATEYLQARTDPFDGQISPCIPDALTLPSKKMKVRCRGTFVAGTTGIGYALWDPFKGFTTESNYNTAVHFAQVLATTSTFANNSLTYSEVLVTGGNLQTFNGDSDYITAGLQFNNQLRLVGAGIRVRYIGTELNRGGRMVLASTSTNNNIVSGSTGGNLLTNNACITVPVTRTWHYVPFSADQSGYFNYISPQTFVGGTTNNGIDHYAYAIYIEGAVPAVSFEFETVGHFEIIGPGTNNITPSHSDVVGMGAVCEAIQANGVMPSASPKGSFDSLYQWSIDSLAHSASGIVQNIPASAWRSLASGAMSYMMDGRGVAHPVPTITEL